LRKPGKRRQKHKKDILLPLTISFTCPILDGNFYVCYKNMMLLDILSKGKKRKGGEAGWKKPKK
jgi:hypothetical protein